MINSDNFDYIEQIEATCHNSDSIVLTHPSSELQTAAKKIRSKMCGHIGGNNRCQLLRLFKVPPTQKLQFIEREYLKSDFQFILACYIFRLKYQHASGSTHGFYIRIDGTAPRKAYDSFVGHMINFSSGGSKPELHCVIPVVNRYLSVFDYLQSLYATRDNLLYNYGHQSDAIPKWGTGIVLINDHTKMFQTTKLMKQLTSTISENMLILPFQYPRSQLAHVLQMNIKEYKSYMRMTTINDFVHAFCQDAYNCALQESSLTAPEVELLLDPTTRRSLINSINTERITKQILLTLRQTFNSSYVHPHPFINLTKGKLEQEVPIDGLLFDFGFLLPFLLCSRWFGKTCMIFEEAQSNNRAHLLLYGNTGTGKSLIMNIFGSVIPMYRYLVQGKFQNPDILSSSMFCIDEFDTRELTSNHFKSLLDIKAPVKVDLKNLHPENVSLGVSCIISTNDDVYSSIRSVGQRGPNPVNQQSVAAAIRRVYTVPMKNGSFEQLHTIFPKESPYYECLGQYREQFEKEPEKLSRMFNLLLVFSLYQEDVHSWNIAPQLQPLLVKLIGEFTDTLFGCFYLSMKEAIDKVLVHFELSNLRQDINDTELQRVMSDCIRELKLKFIQYCTQMSQNNVNQDTIMTLVHSNQVPQPVKCYFLHNDQHFMQRVSATKKDQFALLSIGIREFVTDISILPFINDKKEENFNPYDEVESDLSLISPCQSEPESEPEEPKLAAAQSIGVRRTRLMSLMDSDVDDDGTDELYKYSMKRQRRGGIV